MNPLIIALDGHQAVTDPTSDQFSVWAFQAHLHECPQCAHGLEYCPAGRAKLAATAPSRTIDLPGYPAL